MRWPTDRAQLEALQRKLGELRPGPWTSHPPVTVGGCCVCFGRGGTGPGEVGDRGWAAAVVMEGRRLVDGSQTTGEAPAPYMRGLLAAREGPLLESAVRALPTQPEVLLVNATGWDHPRRAGLALHLGWVLDLPTVGVTHRPLIAAGDPPGPWAGARSPLWIEDEQVGWWLRTRRRTRPVAVTPGWRTGLNTSLEAVEMVVMGARTPEPIRQARRLARSARSRHQEDG
jgi:deoxyribonuclease V